MGNSYNKQNMRIIVVKSLCRTTGYAVTIYPMKCVQTHLHAYKIAINYNRTVKFFFCKSIIYLKPGIN